MLTEYFSLFQESPITPSAYSQARQYLSHTAFIELNRESVVKVVRRDGGKKFLGHRLLAIDSSVIRLPESQELTDKFGSMAVSKDKGELGSYNSARSSVLYDVLNNIAISSFLEPIAVGEQSLVAKHSVNLEDSDVVIMDRGYASYKVLCEVRRKGADFICRTSTSSFKAVNEFISSSDTDKVISVFRPSSVDKKEPEQLLVRAVKVLLSTGEVETLITSLTDQEKYKTDDFQELYGLRWGIETFFHRLKSRLNLENFTAKTAEGVKQDFYATIFVSNLESILTEDADEVLAQKTTQHPQKVNSTVSFHAIKTHVLALLFSNIPSAQVIAELNQIFLRNTTSSRPHRGSKNRLTSPNKQANFYRRRYKPVF